MFRRLILAIILTLALILARASSGMAATGTTNYGHPHGVHWTVCAVHLDYATRQTVTEKDCWHFPIKRANPTGYWHRKTVSSGGHVVTIIKYPTWAPPMPPLGPGCFGAVARVSSLTLIPASILRGLIRVESGGDPSIPSTDGQGSIGCTQPIPSTFSTYADPTCTNVYEPYCNVLFAGRYLSYLMRWYRCDLYTALGHFNGGGWANMTYAAIVLARSY